MLKAFTPHDEFGFHFIDIGVDFAHNFRKAAGIFRCGEQDGQQKGIIAIGPDLACFLLLPQRVIDLLARVIIVHDRRIRGGKGILNHRLIHGEAIWIVGDGFRKRFATIRIHDIAYALNAPIEQRVALLAVTEIEQADRVFQMFCLSADGRSLPNERAHQRIAAGIADALFRCGRRHAGEIIIGLHIGH